MQTAKKRKHAFYIKSRTSVSIQFFHSVACHSPYCVFFFSSLSMLLLFAKTGSVAIHQVQTVTGPAREAWRGTGKIIHSFTHSPARLIESLLITAAFSPLAGGMISTVCDWLLLLTGY